MSYPLSPIAKHQFLDNAGQLAAGYRLYTYAANTSNPEATFSNADGTAANTNPIILDARGECVLYLRPGITYDYVLRSPTNSLVWSRYGIDTAGADSINYVDPVAPKFLKTLSDIVNGEPVSVLRAIPTNAHRDVLSGTDTANRAPAINEMVRDMSSTGRGHLTHEAGTLNIGSPIYIPSDTTFSGGGIKSIVRLSAPSNSILATGGPNARVRDLQILDPNKFAEVGLYLRHDFAMASGLYMVGVRRGIQVETAQYIRIFQNSIIGSDFGIFFRDDGRNSLVDACHIQGGSCIYVGKIGIGCEGLRITNSVLLPNTTSEELSGHGIIIEGGLEITISNNIIDNIDKNGLWLTGATDTRAIKAIGNWFGVDGQRDDSNCVLAVGGIQQLMLLGNTFVGARRWGVDFNAGGKGPANACSITNNRFLNNGQGDIRMAPLLFSSITGNQFSSDASTMEQDNQSIVNFSSNVYRIKPISTSSKSTYSGNYGPDGCNNDTGSYVPELIWDRNVAASQTYTSGWSRVGNRITVSGRVDIAANQANTLTTVRMTLPVFSDLQADYDLAGTATGVVNNVSYGVLADAGNNQAYFQCIPAMTGSQPLSFIFSYTIR